MTRPLLRRYNCCVLLLLVAACDSATGPDVPPTLSVPIVDLSSIQSFIPFGAELPGSGVLNPAYEFVVAGTDTEVRAATAGTVVGIHAKPQGDFEVHMRTPGSRRYLVIYDHVLDLRIANGTTVQPGDVIGLVGIWSATHGRVELQVNRGELSICPRELGTAGFNAAHDAALAAVDPAFKQPEWTDVCLRETVSH